MNNTELLAKIDESFAQGQASQGLSLLRDYNLSNTSDAANWHRQAIIEEQIGDSGKAGQAHYRCIELAPNNAMGYLYGGCWLLKRGLMESAAALFSIADDLDGSILALWQQPGVSSQTQQRSLEANQVLRKFLSAQHREVCANLKNAERIGMAQWVQTNESTPSFEVENYSPELFFIPSLSIKPFYSIKELTWADQLSQHSGKIRSELALAMTQQLAQDSMRPYLDTNFANHTKLGQLANSRNWLAIDLYKDGELNLDVSDLFPETLRLIKNLPTYTLDEHPFEVFFSFLESKQNIAPHFGQSNHALTVHLALDIPDNCYLKVGDETQRWQEGEILAFDDSFLHSAHNDSNETRVVLILSVWHPDLTIEERQAVQHSFRSRQKWSLNRSQHVKQLLSS